MPDTTPVTDALEAQAALDPPIGPGDEGWRKVWGASAYDIQPRDLIMLKWRDRDDIFEYEITYVLPREGLADECAPRFATASGEIVRVGIRQPLVVIRRGRRSTLAKSVR
jgi:hypothetical protein